MKNAGVRLLIIAIIGLCGYLTVHAFIITQPAPAPTSSDQFPIQSRFELPHDYGYFIGDIIPVTLVLETTPDTVLDLVNLPQAGESHGLFEIRDRSITSTKTPVATIYRVTYAVQYFGPAPLTTHFGPLEILYAHTGSSQAAGRGYTYKTLLTQPTMIHIARMSPSHPSQRPTLKGPLHAQNAYFVWLSFSVGTTCMLGALGAWGRAWRTAWKRRQAEATRIPTATEQALQRLQRDVASGSPLADETATGTGEQLDRILREFLRAEYQVSALTLTTAELEQQLNGAPHAKELLDLLERCMVLKYQPASASVAAERDLCQQAVELFETLQREASS